MRSVFCFVLQCFLFPRDNLNWLLFYWGICKIWMMTSRVILAAVSFILLSNYAIFLEMTTHPNLALATRGLTTSTPGLTSTGEIISSPNITTSHWGSGNERRKRSGTSRETALMGVHFQNKTAVSLCLQENNDNTPNDIPMLSLTKLVPKEKAWMCAGMWHNDITIGIWW